MSGTPAPFRLASLVPLAAVSTAVGLGTALAFPFMSLFLSTEVGASPVALGAFLLVMPLASLVASTWLGSVSDARAVRRTLLIVGALAGTAGYGLFAVLRNYWVLLAVSTTLGAVASSLLPQMFAYAKQVLERGGSTKAPLIITVLRTLISLAWVAGPPLAALLVARAGFTGLFAVTALVFAVVALLSFRLPEVAAAPPVEEVVEPVVVGPRPSLPLSVVAFVLLQGAVTLGVITLPLFMTEQLHGTTTDVGLVLGLCAALEIPLMIGLGVLATRVDHRRLVLVGATAALAYHACMLLAQDTWQVAAAQVFSATVISAVMGIGISYFQSLAPDRPGYTTTMFTNSTTVASMLAGPLLAAAQLLTYRTAYGMSLVMSVLGLAFLLLARPRTR
ncbi:sugar efflux transporter [Umezawaea tangerina]|uniref:SET family sugar efflux transporter-like MFS transporter n=1 Tax=Umezawaea tangerina TaxID=84725 RepID=A0A2T0T500_9PSEU|nr:sugar efflux transporter [Umezawaea tangerina]PRY40709.1 SET family sugar efflux transporter-like MFS transporter [Umezawaea tangerina]